MKYPQGHRRAVNILLVEDNPAAAHLTKVALLDTAVVYDIHLVEDGEAALDFLFRRPPFTDAPRPDMILLDLDLPKIDGREVLENLEADESLSTVPVVVLTTSNAPGDIKDAYRHHASCFITKPFGVDEYFTAIRSLKELWLNAASLPEDRKVVAAKRPD